MSQPHSLSEEQILADMVAIITKELPSVTRPLDAETSLTKDLTLDSLQMMTLVVAIENHFHICLDTLSDEPSLDSLKSLAQKIKQLQDSTADEKILS